jgi:hypothetical protein
MWFREVARVPTPWMRDGTLTKYFVAVASLFPADLKSSWELQMGWLRSAESEQYRLEIRRGLDRIRRREIK